MFLKKKRVNSYCSVTVSTKCFSMCLCVHVCLFIVASTAQCCIVCGPTLSFLAGQNPRKQERNPNKDTGVHFFHIFLNLTLPVSTSSHHWTPKPPSTEQSHFPNNVLSPNAHLGFMRTGVEPGSVLWTRSQIHKTNKKYIQTHGHPPWRAMLWVNRNLPCTNSHMTCLNVFLLDEPIWSERQQWVKRLQASEKTSWLPPWYVRKPFPVKENFFCLRDFPSCLTSAPSSLPPSLSSFHAQELHVLNCLSSMFDHLQPQCRTVIRKQFHTNLDISSIIINLNHSFCLLVFLSLSLTFTAHQRASDTLQLLSAGAARPPGFMEKMIPPLVSHVCSQGRPHLAPRPHVPLFLIPPFPLLSFLISLLSCAHPAFTSLSSHPSVDPGSLTCPRVPTHHGIFISR